GRRLMAYVGVTKGGVPVKRNVMVIVLVVTSLVFAVGWHTGSADAQEGHQHRHDPSEKLGRVNFTVSCNPEAQRQFNRAVAWLHSFEYEEAEKTFNEVIATDSRCGMGYWASR